jgi:DNA polymerase-3 subunit delta
MLQQAKRMPLDPVIGLIGGDPLLRQRFREVLVKRALPAAVAEMNLGRYQVGETPMPEILAACQDYPCFAERRVVLLSDLGKMKKKDAEPFVAYLKSPQPTTCLIAESDKLDGRLDWVKVFKKTAKLVEFSVLGKAECHDWVEECFKQEGKKWEEGVPENLLEWIGLDLGALEQSVAQLALWVGDRPELTRRDLEELLRPVSVENIFEVIDSFFSAEPAVKYRRLDRLMASGEAPLKILSLIYRHLSILLALSKSRPGEAWSVFPMAPGFRNRYEQQAGRYASGLHYGLLEPLTRADRKIKGSPLKKELILKEAVEELGRLFS